MRNETIRLVCFDLGGVVVRTCGSWELACSRAGLPAHEPADRREFEERVRAADDRHQLGLFTDEEFFREIARCTGGQYEPEEIARIHEAWLLGEYAGMDRLVAELNARDGLQTACLSNTNHRHWIVMGDTSSRSDFPAFRMLSHRHASHLLGIAKPHPDIYRAFERQTARSGREILFFDDREENVDAARAVGWNAEWIDAAGDTSGQARAHLRRYGIL
jgi:putative hydrolase of the HAD superfamily